MSSQDGLPDNYRELRLHVSPELYAWLVAEARRLGYGGGGDHGTDPDGVAHGILTDSWFRGGDAPAP